MNKATREFVFQWMKKAEEDLLVVKKLTEFEMVALSSVCFHCQQAVEKYLKAYLIFILLTTPLFTFPNTKIYTGKHHETFSKTNSFGNIDDLVFHNDSIHQLNFRYPDKKRGIKPWIAPTLLISSGTALHFMSGTKESVRDFMQDNFAYHGTFDDYAQYAPVAAVYALSAMGIQGKNNFGNKTAIAIKSFLVNGLITDRLKYWVNETRPSGGVRSFPSGHTSKTFSFAHFMHKEFGELSPWYSIGAYSCATTVAVMRVAKNAHWVSDVLMGAGIGIFSTELVYLTHQYKWDNEHLKRFDIFPFQLGNQKGVTLVYNF